MSFVVPFAGGVPSRVWASLRWNSQGAVGRLWHLLGGGWLAAIQHGGGSFLRDYSRCRILSL